jgi:hypothetical protein
MAIFPGEEAHMQTKLMMVAACAVLALGARAHAGDEKGTSTGAQGQATGSAASQPGEAAGQKQADPSLQPTEAERQAGGAIGRQPGDTKSVVGTVEKVEKDRLTLKVGTETQELEIDESTKITSEQQPFQRDQLAEGAEVRASFHGDSMRATEIHVMSTGPTSGPQGEGRQPSSVPPPPSGEKTETQPSPSESAVPERPPSR